MRIRKGATRPTSTLGAPRTRAATGNSTRLHRSSRASLSESKRHHVAPTSRATATSTKTRRGMFLSIKVPVQEFATLGPIDDWAVRSRKDGHPRAPVLRGPKLWHALGRGGGSPAWGGDAPGACPVRGVCCGPCRSGSWDRVRAVTAAHPAGASGGVSCLRYATRSTSSCTVSVSLKDGIFEEPSAAS